jgi:hypothetical protein
LDEKLRFAQRFKVGQVSLSADGPLVDDQLPAPDEIYRRAPVRSRDTVLEGFPPTYS